MDKPDSTKSEYEAQTTRLDNDYCNDCGKPLGGTEELCYECGGEKPTLSREERLANARMWKAMMWIPPEKVDEAHGTNYYGTLDDN